MMKYLFVVLSLATLAFGGENNTPNALEELEGMIANCLEKHSIDNATLELLFKDEFPKDTEDEKCFIKCMYEKMEFINDKGEMILFDKEENIPEDVTLKESLEKCKNYIVNTCDDVVPFDNCMDSALVQKLTSNRK